MRELSFFHELADSSTSLIQFHELLFWNLTVAPEVSSRRVAESVRVHVSSQAQLSQWVCDRGQTVRLRDKA